MSQDPMYFFKYIRIATRKGPKKWGSVMAPEQEAILAALAPSLLSVARGQEPAIGRFWVEGVKAWAKSLIIAACNLWLGLFSSVPIYSQLAAADRQQADEAGKHSRDVGYLNAWIAERIDVQNWKMVGSNFECDTVAADEAGSHGGRALFIGIDELSAITRTNFVLNLLDNAAKVGGIVIVALNAGFKDSEAYRLREIALNSPLWSFHQLTSPPHWVDRADIDDAAKRNSAERQARLWGGVWSEGSGEGLDWEDIKACIVHKHDMSRVPSEHDLRHGGWTFWAGLDVGIRKNWTAYCVVGIKSGEPNMRVALCKSWAPQSGTREVDLGAVERYIVAASRRFLPRVTMVDFHQAGFMMQRLRANQRVCESVSFGPKSLAEMASTILMLTKCRTVEFSEDQGQLCNDLRRVVITETQFGQKIQSLTSADGQHFDMGSAFVYAALPAAQRTAGNGGAIPKPTGMRIVPDGSRYGIFSGGGNYAHFVRKMMFGASVPDPRERGRKPTLAEWRGEA